MQENDWTKRVHEAINRCLTLLGYKSEVDREKALARFLSWIGFLEAYLGYSDGEAKVTWTEAMLATLRDSPMMTSASRAEYAVGAADIVLAQQMRRFPPRMVEDVEMAQEPREDVAKLLDEADALAAADSHVWRETIDLVDRMATALRTIDVERNEEETRIFAEQARCIANLEAKLAERDADLLKYGAEIDALRKDNIDAGDMPIIKANLAKLVGSDVSISLDELAEELGNLIKRWESTACDLRKELDLVQGMLRVEQSKRDHDRSEHRRVERERDRALDDAKKALAERDSWRDNFRDADEIIKGVRLAFGFKDGDYCDLVAEAQKAILPKPKPSKVEPGQRWAFVMKAVNGIHESNVRANFVDAYGASYKATDKDLTEAIFLG